MSIDRFYYPMVTTQQVLLAVEGDHDFLVKGEVFTEDLIATWCEYKREKEIDAVRLLPHPYEFYL